MSSSGITPGTDILPSASFSDKGSCLSNTAIRRIASLVMIALACVAAYFCFYYGEHFNLSPQNNLLLRNLLYSIGSIYCMAALANGIYACIGCEDKDEKDDKKGEMFYYDPLKATAQFFLTLFAPVVFAGLVIGYPIYMCTQLPGCKGKSESQVQTI